MHKNYNRRKFVKQISLILSALYLPSKVLWANEKVGNFKYIYNNDNYSKEFYPFLINVFHLLPEKELHRLIQKASQIKNTDEEIYKFVQKNISSIKPFLADLTYALPALKKQKYIMAEQTKQLLSEKEEISGYLEIGSKGRYLDSLEGIFNIENVSLMDDEKAGYGPIDMIERGQILKAGKHINFNDYNSETIKSNSKDLITMFIGMHHCPVELRDNFLQNIRDGLSKNGSFIIRDHDANNEKMQRIVSLAHDVFNMGTMETWKVNKNERRNFYSLAFLEDLMAKNGFKKVSGNLYQKGDPSKNALMRFQKR